MEDAKRDNNIKIKRSKYDVKNSVMSYLQRRNYPTFQPVESTQDQFILKNSIEKALSSPNSILYSSSNGEPANYDQIFTKFVKMCNEQCADLKPMIGHLFCHFYFEILKSGQLDKAINFYKAHISTIDRSRCDKYLLDVIQIVGNNADASNAKLLFKNKKLSLNVTEMSMLELKKFTSDCHVCFLKILQNYFDLNVKNDADMGMETSDDYFTYNKKFPSLEQVIADLNNMPKPIFNVRLENCKNPPTCGVMKRYSGVVSYSVNNVIYLMPLNCLDNLLHLDGEFDKVRFVNHSSKVYCIEISPSNTILASVSSDHTLAIFNLTDMTLIKKCYGHTAPVYCVRFSSNSLLIATGSIDNTARLWESSTGKMLRIFLGHSQSVNSVDFHPNCLYLATGSADKNARMWCVNKGVALRLFHAAKAAVYCVNFSPNGKLLAAASEDKKIRLWDLLTSKVVIELRCKDAPILKMVWSKSGNELCSGTIDGLIKIWDVEKIQNSVEVTKNCEPNQCQSLNARLLSLEYEFGTFAALTA